MIAGSFRAQSTQRFPPGRLSRQSRDVKKQSWGIFTSRFCRLAFRPVREGPCKEFFFWEVHVDV